MADLPLTPALSSSTGSIRVAPSRIDVAAAAVRALGAAVHPAGATLETALLLRADGAIGDPVTGAALGSAARLVLQAIGSASDGIDDLGRAMGAATSAYRLADGSAVGGAAG